GHVGKGAARFDLAKLQNLNGHYLREADDVRLAALVAPRMSGTVDLDLLTRAMPVLKVRAKDLNELAAGAAFLFATRPLAMEAKAEALLTAESRELLGKISARLAVLGEWTIEGLETSLKAMAEERGLGLGKLAQPLRAALTGQTTSPGIFDVLVLLGQDESLARIDAQAITADARSA
ncbi:MAG: glutamate--tRNA ligase, partial [Sphingomonadales bacterium]|nr:glutamate--tRNA ligase [Sphingomonadales bacterium]